MTLYERNFHVSWAEALRSLERFERFELLESSVRKGEGKVAS